MQTNYDINQAVGMLGMLASDTAPRFIEGGIAKEAIGVGSGISKVIGSDDQVRLPAANQGKVTFDADFVASNVINMTVNGTAIAPVTYATSHANTLALVAAAIAAVTTYVASASATGAREITVNGIDDVDVAITAIVVTLGLSQANGTFTKGTRDKLHGVAMLSQALEGNLPGVDTVPTVPAKSLVNVVRQGKVFVYFETAFNPDTDTLYCRFFDGGAGKAVGQFRNTDDSGTAFAVAGNFAVRSALSGAGIGVLELNRPV